MRRTDMLLTGAAMLLLAGCGSSNRQSTHGIRNGSSVPAYVTEPFTPEQHLIEQGARLIVADGCASCHLTLSKPAVGPSFSSFAGHRVRLKDGRGVLVDEAFLRSGLIDPRGNELKGYDPAPMIAALARLHLRSEPHRVAALAAFIEQIGPEPE
jgi:hypothetical protein